MPGQSTEEVKNNFAHACKKHFEKLCNASFDRDSGQFYSVKTSHIKLLPPLKRPSKRSQNGNFLSANKDYSTTEINLSDGEMYANINFEDEKNTWHSDESSQVFLRNDSKPCKSESKISVRTDTIEESGFNELPKQSNSLSPCQIAWLDDW